MCGCVCVWLCVCVCVCVRVCVCVPQFAYHAACVETMYEHLRRSVAHIASQVCGGACLPCCCRLTITLHVATSVGQRTEAAREAVACAARLAT